MRENLLKGQCISEHAELKKSQFDNKSQIRPVRISLKQLEIIVLLGSVSKCKFVLF